MACPLIRLAAPTRCVWGEGPPKHHRTCWQAISTKYYATGASITFLNPSVLPMFFDPSSRTSSWTPTFDLPARSFDPRRIEQAWSRKILTLIFFLDCPRVFKAPGDFYFTLVQCMGHPCEHRSSKKFLSHLAAMGSAGTAPNGSPLAFSMISVK